VVRVYILGTSLIIGLWRCLVRIHTPIADDSDDVLFVALCLAAIALFLIVNATERILEDRD